MPAERFFVDQPLEPSHSVILQGQEFHHLKNVMRMRVGEAVEVSNGAGALAHVTVLQLAKDHAVLTITAMEYEQKCEVDIILAQAWPRSNRLDFILEKGTELGVTQFWLYPSFHSPKKAPTEHQLERMKALTIAAMKQCGRLFLPELIIKPPLIQWKKPEGTCFFGDIRPSATHFLSAWERMPKVSPIIFFVGPESGFTEEEVANFDRLGVQGVKLHKNVLRTETAALVALSLIEAGLANDVVA